METWKMFLDFSHTRWYEEKKPKTFFIAKLALFWNVCFYRHLRSQRNDLIICTKSVKTPFGPLWIFLWHLSSWIILEKIGQNLFITGKIAFFFETFVLNNLIVPKKRSFTFHSNCQISLWILMTCSLIFVTLDDTRKKKPKNFSSSN